MSEDTKFPDSFKDYLARDGLLEEVIESEDVRDWFKKMMDDFPTCVDGITVRNGQVFPATLDVPIEVTAWFNKWFSQFVEGA